MSRSSLSDLLEVVDRLTVDVGSPRALTVAILLRYGEWDQLADLRCDPSHYLTPGAYYRDVSVTDLLRKMEDLPTTVDKPAKARETFVSCERMCFRTNERLSPFLFGVGSREDGSPYGRSEEVVQSTIDGARKMIGAILGNTPEDCFLGRFGPGATFADKGQLTTVADKISSRPTLTASAIPWLFQWTATAWASACAEAGKDPVFVQGNRFTTVPKDATKHRGIAVEPSLNVFYQLGLGRLIRKKLRGAGIDLQHGQDIHRRVACEASIKGHFATIDLSNASDTVCRNLVRLLLPHRWWSLLDSLRSPKTFVDGKWVVLEKFSSMGNGYTFELETCLFLGICCSVLQQLGCIPLPGVNVFVYGDDIIVPSEFSGEVLSALRFFGFSENPKKTFTDGPFRESCGGDFFNGVAVRPHYLKANPVAPQDWIALANGLYRLCKDGPNGFSERFPASARMRCLDRIPSSIRACKGPAELGDLVVNDRTGGIIQWKDGIRYWRVFRPVSTKRISWGHFRPQVVLASALLFVGSGREGITPRDSVTGYKFDWVPLS